LNHTYHWLNPFHRDLNKRTLLWLISWIVLGFVSFGLSRRLVFASSPPAGGQAATPPAPANLLFVPLVYRSLPDPAGSRGGPAPNPGSANGLAINAAGDIAACSPRYFLQDGYLQTAALLAQLDGPFLGLGDYVYPDGTLPLFTTCFDPVWGPFKPRLFPSPGNHEYQINQAAGYFGYFGAAAGDPTQGFYSFNVGNWHIVALNSNCSEIGGCALGSPQELWLRADLAAHPDFCTLAYWHHPLYTSGKEGSDARVKDLYQDLIDARADLILNGHDHDYERFAPQDANGNFDEVNGIPEIIVGTGGKDHGSLVRRLPNSLVFDNTTFGILRIQLRADGYDFRFVPVAGGVFQDAGSGNCH
jgi:hypothetical protein